MMFNVTEKLFNETVLLPSMKAPVAVLFHAPWCGPCKVVKPRIMELATAHGFRLIGVDAGEQKELARFYGVRSVPALTVFSQGRVVGTQVGVQEPAEVLAFLDKHAVCAPNHARSPQ